MKLFALIIILLTSCEKKVDNIELTAFTKEFISMYVSEIEITEYADKPSVIVMNIFVDSSRYNLNIFSYDGDQFNYCRDDYIGETRLNNTLVKVFGDSCPIFYNFKNKISQSIPCVDNMLEYDPLVWNLALNADSSFNKMRTYCIEPNGDISSVCDLVKKYFVIPDTVPDDVYIWYHIENEPVLKIGDYKLDSIISANSNLSRKQYNSDNISASVEILVNKEGKASLIGILESSGNKEFDIEVLRVARIICNEEFRPATHRGEIVNVIIYIGFSKI